MDKLTIAEDSYKRGYEKGLQDAAVKKQIKCPQCKGNGYITVMTGDRKDYCGVMNEKCRACSGTGLNLVDMTNADRIRAMSDEELAQIIMCPYDSEPDLCCAQGTCLDCCEKWLKQPAEVDHE